MSNDISLLPEGMRKREETLKQTEPQRKEPVQDLRFSVPVEEGEDIEVIEIDEGEVDQVLASEPLLTRITFRISSFFDELKEKLTQPQAAEPPPKLPPQFFKPPAPKPVTPPPAAPTVPTPKPAGAPAPMAATPMAPKPLTPAAMPSAKPKARIIPAAAAPKRVRVIRRVRKPLHVSFVSEEDLRMLRVDVPKRRFTFIVLLSVFLIATLGGWYALNRLQSMADGGLSTVHAQIVDVETSIADRQKTWALFTSLEPRLRALGTLLDTHVSPTSLLQRIEQSTLPTISYSSFSMTPDMHVLLGVNAASYEDAARQVVAMQKADFVKNVTVSGYTARYEAGSAAPSNVQYQMTMTLSDRALQSPSRSMANK